MAARFLAFGEQIAKTIKRAVISMIQAFKPFFEFVGRGLGLVFDGIQAVFDRIQMAQREMEVMKKCVDPKKIYKSVLSGYKAEQGIGGLNSSRLSVGQKRRYSVVITRL